MRNRMIFSLALIVLGFTMILLFQSTPPEAEKVYGPTMYPYATLDKDNFELQAISQNDKEEYEFPLPDFPSDDERFNLKKGDLVKLIFLYNESFEVKGTKSTVERMWVEVTVIEGSSIQGKIGNDPIKKGVLKYGDPVYFHPNHVIQIYKEG